MEYVCRLCDPLQLSLLCAAVARGDLPNNAVAITLDDGYLDALAASDILLALDMPATFFVNTNPGEETFHDTLARIMLETEPLPAELALEPRAGEPNLPTRTSSERAFAFKHVNELAWTMTFHQRSHLIRKLQAWSDAHLTPRDTHRALTRRELRALASRPRHQIGAHTSHHLFMPAQSRTTQMEEVASNLRYLKDATGRSVTTFAYPYGGVDLQSASVVRRFGFNHAVTVVPRALTPSADPILIPRIEITATKQIQFESLLEELLH
jgi:peptidoglycan/xylan/chitin deacetylase (PgdA/CDA1 family)